MKTLYIGACNSLSAAIVNRLVKEEEELYIVSEQDFIKEIKPTLKYRYYKYSSNDNGIDKVFASINPDTVIFAGSQYTHEVWEHDTVSNQYLSSLLNIINMSVKHSVGQFIYLSNKEVYGASDSIRGESEQRKPSSYKGLLCFEGENLVESFSNLYSLKTIILRFDDIYGFALSENAGDFLSNMIQSIHINKEYSGNSNRKVQAVHVNDCADAVFRVKQVSPSSIYNISSNHVYSEDELAQMLIRSYGLNYEMISVQGENKSYLNDNAKIKKELEWVEFYTLGTLIESKSFNIQSSLKTQSILKKDKPKSSIILTIENIIVFIFFAGLTILFKRHSMLSTIDFMSLYIIIMALSFGVRQSIVSVLLSIGFYLLSSGIESFNIINILTNLENILVIVQYIFYGAAIGYSVDYGKTKIKAQMTEYDYLSKEYKELKDINQDNILIKQEYEKRLLNDRTSLPRLYSIISRLTVLEPEKIFLEAVEVIKDIMDTETVSIYSANNRNSYIRLSVASSEEAIFIGKSVDISKFQGLQKAMANNEVYVGDQWTENEPSLAAPVFHKGNCIAIIVINDMKFEHLNLYQVNLLRTLSILISSSMAKARDFEIATKETKYIENTDIMKTSYFEQLVEIEKEKNVKGLSNYSIIKILSDENMIVIYNKISNLFRDTDHIGLSNENELVVLLGNTQRKDMEYVINRLMNMGITAVPVHY